MLVFVLFKREAAVQWFPSVERGLEYVRIQVVFAKIFVSMLMVTTGLFWQVLWGSYPDVPRSSLLLHGSGSKHDHNGS